MRWMARLLAAAVVLAAAMGNAQQAPAKLALVIGVSDYGQNRAAQEAAGFVVPPALANAVRDSALVADSLAAQGFQVVRVTNPDKRAMLAAVNAFGATLSRAGPDAVGVFYFAGHGAQGRPALERDIDNYLIPLGADLVTEVDLDSEALGLSRVSATIQPGVRGAVVLILDACRNFALPTVNRSGLVTRGLAEARAAPGTIIAYATSPGATALDALPGQTNGPYALALSAQVRAAAGTRLEDVFIAVRNKVLEGTRNTQVPWENGSLRRAVVLGIAPSIRASDLAPPVQPVAPAPILTAEVNDAINTMDDARIADLLRRGWNPNGLLDTESNTALHLLMGVCERNRSHDRIRLTAVARLLIDAGADKTRQNGFSDTPLTIARSPRYCGPNHPVVALLQ